LNNRQGLVSSDLEEQEIVLGQAVGVWKIGEILSHLNAAFDIDLSFVERYSPLFDSSEIQKFCFYALAS